MNDKEITLAKIVKKLIVSELYGSHDANNSWIAFLKDKNSSNLKVFG